MVEDISIILIIIAAVWFILHTILKSLAGNEPEDPCKGCTGCSMPGDTKDPVRCTAGGSCRSSGSSLKFRQVQ